MQGIHLRKYGVEAKIPFVLYEVDGVDFRVDAADAGSDCSVMKDEGAEATCTNDFVDEGQGYSITLTATEMQAARIVVYVVDSATKVWLDDALVIETYGNASAQHAIDFDDSVRAGLTALPNAAADGAGGLTISDAGGLDLDTQDSVIDAIATDTAQIGNAAGASIAADLLVIDNLVDDLETRLSAARAGYLDNLSAGAVALASGVDVTSIDGQDTSGNNATLNLKQLNIVNSAGDAIVASSTGSNGHGIAASGNGTGEGLQATGGATGSGIEATGGATSGHGLRAVCQNGDNHGLICEGEGSGEGIYAVGGATGNGIWALGGATSGAGILAQGQTSGDGIKAAAAGNAHGINTSGNGSGDGIQSTGGATGHGLDTIGGATSGTGINAIAQTNGHGMELQGASGGEGLKAIGGSTGHGIQGQGGSSSGSGFYANAAAGNAAGFLTEGQGTGEGLSSTGGATGNGIQATGGVTSGVGIRAEAQANNDPGLECIAHGTGDDIDASTIDNIVAAIADGVWDEAQSGHVGAGTFGELATEIASILADTNELQGDLANGGRLDLLIDAIKAVTDNLSAAAGTMVTGTVSHDNTAASTTVFYSDDITEATADHYIGRVVIFTSGALQYQATDITDYALDTGEGKFTVTALTEAPADNVTFVIV